MNKVSQCPLCNSEETLQYHADRYRTFFTCPDCGLVHVPREYHLSHAVEKQRYDMHNNNPEDKGYRRFLGRLVEPMAEKLPKGAAGLDYGSGPVPVLASMLVERGFVVALYDPYYAADPGVLDHKYDFLTCCETMEHFSEPLKEWEQFLKLVKKGGLLGIMTQFVESAPDFARWYYIQDETHTCFYSRRTFDWLGERYGVKMSYIGMSVVIVQV